MSEAADSIDNPPRTSRWLIALGVYWLVLFTATHVPTPELVAGAMELNVDKLIHLTAYALLATLMLAAWRSLGWRRVGWTTLLVAVGYAVFDEFTQPLVGRICDALDLLADVAGVFLALAIDRVRQTVNASRVRSLADS